MKNNFQSGQLNSNAGYKYEVDLGSQLGNLQNWKKPSPLIQEILLAENLIPSLITAVSSSTVIKRLSSRGPAKTDLVVTISTQNGNVKKICFSCKQSKAKQVSFHEHSADDFISVLKLNDKTAENLIRQHQKDGNKENIRGRKREYLTEKLSNPIIKKILAEWVILGKHHLGTKQDDQIVDYVICNDRLKTFGQYESKLNKSKAIFGTGFSWTHASGSRGKKIQLKGPVL
jgi:hypothetical protein